jgi:hypothetical protein
MFIMAIGMLALLTLFPLGAISMGQALRDDRAATAAAMAANLAIANDLRHDAGVIGTIPSTPSTGGTGNMFIAPGAAWTTLPGTYFGPSYPVYVDPYGWALGPIGAGAGSPGIQRVIPAFISSEVGGASLPNTDPWFSFLGDMTFTNAGVADTTSVGAGKVDRAGNVTWAYLLRRRNTWDDNNVDLSVVVYWKRQIGALALEPTFAATGTAGQSSITFSGFADVRRGGWILDTTLAVYPNNPNAPYTPPPAAPAPQAAFTAPSIVQGYFYQVINVTDVGGITTIDVQPTLKANVSAVTVMNDVQTVAERGVSWQP